MRPFTAYAISLVGIHCTITEVQEIESQDIREWAKFYALDLERPALAVDLLTVNEYSRPGEELPEVKSIFIHYTANAGTTAEQNRSYFESLSESHERSASAHFVIGYDGVIVQCIPTKEIAYAYPMHPHVPHNISGSFSRLHHNA